MGPINEWKIFPEISIISHKFQKNGKKNEGMCRSENGKNLPFQWWKITTHGENIGTKFFDPSLLV